MSNNLIDSTFSLFENIKHIDDDGNEYWFARELMNALDYKQWRRFCNTIDKAKLSCMNSNVDIFYHFASAGKMVEIGVSTRKIDDYKLSRYACYLIAQNSDPRKEVVALAQSYFATKTRKQELLEQEYNSLTEDQKGYIIVIK
ncbi:MAG: hypothetical protein IKX00_03965 [Bacilli bacterium]|nr:hypothetical protein [Bacilli bacterium]